jgi:hypothetical protein
MLTYEERTINELQDSADRSWFALQEVNQALHELGLLDEVRSKVAEIAERDFLPDRTYEFNGKTGTRDACYRLVWVSGCKILADKRNPYPVWQAPRTTKYVGDDI